MSISYRDARARRLHKVRNAVQTWLLVSGSLALLAATAWVLAGVAGLVWAVALGAATLMVSLRVSPAMILRLYQARRLREGEAAQCQSIVRELARRAELPAVPRLHYVPSAAMNAFAVGRPDNSAICVTDGLLRGLTPRQLAGVLAHEISHIRNGDIRVMAVADMVSRLTGAMSTVGILLLFLNLPFLMTGAVPVPWPGIVLLVSAPTVGALMQFALSRAREYDADLDAADLTGDPEGLASALVALERRHGRVWEMMLPGQRIPDPSLLRTHPRTQDRVERLMSLAAAGRGRPLDLPAAAPEPVRTVPVVRPPRFRVSGLWY